MAVSIFFSFSFSNSPEAPPSSSDIWRMVRCLLGNVVMDGCGVNVVRWAIRAVLVEEGEKAEDWWVDRASMRIADKDFILDMVLLVLLVSVSVGECRLFCCGIGSRLWRSVERMDRFSSVFLL